MGERNLFLDIDLGLDSSDPVSNEIRYQLVEAQLRKILPEDHFLYSDQKKGLSSYSERDFQKNLPALKMLMGEGVPCQASFLFLSKYRSDAFKFFFNMLTSWLVPRQRLDVFLFDASDFRIPDLGEGLYTICELTAHIKGDVERREIEKNYPALEKELALGIRSLDQASRILEVKGLTAHQKTSLVRERLSCLVRKRPQNFDQDLYLEMQHVLVMCPEAFKSIRDSRHLSRIISMHYLFRKALNQAIENAPDKRHLYLKLFQARLNLGDSEKVVLGIIVGLNFLGDKEIFEDRHVLKAIQYYIPEVSIVEDSFFSLQRGVDHVTTIYLEVEKSDSRGFSPEEIRKLRQGLPADLRDRIEQLMHPIFMPRNEEEVMRNIITLSHQLCCVTDSPQLLISFDEQTNFNLFFTIVMVRVVNAKSEPVLELFRKADTFLDCDQDFTKMVGSIGKRKLHKKEATVFRVKLPKDMFLRDDHSIDLYKARQVILAEIERVFGPVRDFYGGLISKQHELLSTLRSLLAEEGMFHDFMLENYFYSLTPTLFRSAFDVRALKTLFLMLLDAIEKKGVKPLVFEEYRELDKIFLMISSEMPQMKQLFDKAIESLSLLPDQLGQVFLFANDAPYLGYIFCSDDPYTQEHFCQTLKREFEELIQFPLCR